MNRASALIACLALAACAPKPIVATHTADWRAVVTAADRTKLHDWRQAFIEALAQARTTNAADVAKEGALLDPDAALGGPIPNGMYRCRVIKLGAKTPGMLNYVSYPAFSCRVQAEHGIQGFAKLTGSQRPVGLIFPGDQLRQVFLGTITLGDEVRAMQYGNDPDRDVAAFVERIGDARWRMVIPRPAFESRTDVIELVPAT
ncbi:DUF4893 domain-containing protein [Sphingomonas alba]|uniref:DUF4893 domain-containing protein n=1 Tax=Sphingomonas alba TaxID=2908208 RepID=A0ABT0RPF2_9SPHN|nr:DUF4893 domain-containing protein [Sphingomonas alba]